MPRSFLAFAVVTLLPLPLLLAGALFGGWAPWLALAYVTLVMAGIDEFQPALSYDGEAAEQDEADLLSQMLAGTHLVLLLITIWSLAGGGPGLFSLSGIALFLGAGLFFGQVSASNAASLVHRQEPQMRMLGTALYISLLSGHRATVEPYVHHVYVGTKHDPMTSHEGESLWQYLPRALLGGLRTAVKVEKHRRASSDLPIWHLSNPLLQYAGGAVAMLLAALLVAGPGGLVVFILLCAFAQLQMTIRDFIQHHGLTRALDANGQYVAVNATHSWNAPHWLSALWMLNATRHSDHHANPAGPYTQRAAPPRGEVPTLPHSLPVMAGIALHPPTWRKVMEPHLEAWRDA
ncbi:alkane 1-monooxygenase [uncultured Litoreibacter sp.]|uniref:alkane 1-monooxygenase n=1 Tax=uncultured Litoreibacter sp. TaxID=1392394 RepID=UPI0026196DAB|nr:alkane 1-monooxygenase [uncultured Litoreibacter sp.]